MSKTLLSDDHLTIMTLGHLASEGMDDIFRPPLLNEGVEFTEFSSTRFCFELRRRVKSFLSSPSDQGFSPVLRMAVPKTRYTYRHASLIDFEDLAKYTAIVFKIGAHIEQARIPAAERVIFSSRFKEGIPCVDRTYNFDLFRETSSVMTKNPDCKVKIITDISNFYDRLNLHRLESILVDIGCDHKSVKAINQILLHWAGRNSYGIPVGCDASRILAEAMLINVDNELQAKKIPFVRYVDDYRIFASSYSEAHSFLGVLTESLSQEGLFLNSEKTKMFEGADEVDDANVQPAQDFDAINEGEKVAAIRFVGTGYRTKISTYYREPGKEAIKKLQEVDINKLLPEIMGPDAKEDQLRLFVKAFIYGKNHDVGLLTQFIGRHVHMLGYLVSALVKEGDRIAPDVRENIKVKMIEFYYTIGSVDFYRICIGRLVSSKLYFAEGIFGRWFLELGVDSNPIFIRELITFFCHKLSREELRALVRYSHNGHPATRRAIIRAALTSEKCLDGEKRAWARVWNNSSDDAFAQSSCRDFLFGVESGP